MKTSTLFISLLVLSLVANSQNCNKWMLGYLCSYHQAPNGDASWLSAYDMSRLTHIGHHGFYLYGDGSLDYNANGMTHEKMLGAVQHAHAHGKPIVVSVVSWISYLNILSTPENRTRCINQLLQVMDTYGYDGIDVDLEPVMSPYVAGMQYDNPVYRAFVNQLYDSLSTRYNAFLGRQPLLVAAVNSYAAPALKQLENQLDQMNIMTYDMTNGWTDYNNFTWHDSPVFDYGNNLPCVHSMVNEMLAQGIAPGKIGIGVSADAFRWQGGSGTSTGGVTAPMQYYTSTPSWTRFSYAQMMQYVYQQAYYRWDNVAKMSYLSIDMPNNADDQFWSYNDEASCQAKAQYVLDHNLGGIIMWELYSGMLSWASFTNHIPQLTATYNTLCGSTNVSKTSDEMQVMVYPTMLCKGGNTITIKNIPENATIYISDVLGRTIYNDKTNSIESVTIKVDFNNSGVYVLNINSENHVQTVKLVVK